MVKCPLFFSCCCPVLPRPLLRFLPKVYSPEGYERVRNTEGIRDVLLRHFPDVAKQIPESQSGFKPWGVWA